MRRAITGLVLSLTSALVMVAGPVEAVVISYTSRAAFGAAVSDEVVEDWDSYANGTVILDGTSLAGITYSTTAGDSLVTSTFLPLSPPNGLGGTTTGFFTGADTITFSFASPIYAFGISFNTFATTAGAYLLTTSAGVAASGFDPFPGFGTGQFAGLVSDTAFSSVTISAPSGTSYTLDDLNYAVAAVPEPSTLLLLGLGLAGLGLRQARRRF